jgi:two-component system nitrate/nitrite response regulator NarL
MPDLRVLIVADDPLVRAGLAALLADRPGCAVVGQVAEDGDLESALEAYHPDAIVWDLGWDGGPASPAGDPLSGLEHLAELTGADLPLVVLLADEGRAVPAYLAGARGLLPRDTSGERLAAALMAAAEGLVVLDPPLADPLFGAREQSAAPLVEELTPREMEVLQLLAEGLANKAIAQRLDISEHTVKFHVNALMGKLGAQSRTEAVVRATRLGLILL